MTAQHPSRPVPAPRQATAIVVGRYAGAVGVLADLLTQGGVLVRASAAADRDGSDGVRQLLDASPADVVCVLTVAPGDDTLSAVRAVRPAARLVAVTWHPADELPVMNPGITQVTAGNIRRTLAGTVLAVAAGDRS